MRDGGSPEIAYAGGDTLCTCSTPAGCGGGIFAGIASGWWRKAVGAVMKAREWSEIAAGPRWKNFIRRFNKNCGCSKIARKFQYDPLSYALNFDDGFAGDECPQIDEGFGDFSSRYVIMPPAKERMDF